MAGRPATPPNEHGQITVRSLPTAPEARPIIVAIAYRKNQDGRLLRVTARGATEGDARAKLLLRLGSDSAEAQVLAVERALKVLRAADPVVVAGIAARSQRE